MKKVILPLTAVALAFFTSFCLAADDSADARAKKIAGDFFQSYSRTFASGNAEALSAHWKSDGEIVDAEGMRTLGRAAIEKTFADFFANNRGSKITIELLSAKPEGEDVIVAEILPKIDPPISKSICQAGAMAVLVKDAGGKWLIEGVREKDPLPASYGHLKQLEWMVGDWAVNAKKAENVIFSVHCHWTENKSFLICMYTAKHLDVVRHGTQVIGWDAKEKKIRSWMFDSNGGFAGGLWEKTGNRWKIDMSGLSPEGEIVKGTQILAAVDADTFSFESTNRSKGGEKTADVPLLEMQRVKSQLPHEKSGG
ncbi:MAG: hypothetical protein IT426_03705 [Pirellulales bacterium]|nr:hypothetical protein [Pirellulales bacterium]